MSESIPVDDRQMQIDAFLADIRQVLQAPDVTTRLLAASLVYVTQEEDATEVRELVVGARLMRNAAHVHCLLSNTATYGLFPEITETLEKLRDGLLASYAAQAKPDLP